MMLDGYWLNYETMKWNTITEHETWIRDETNATKIGVPPEVVERFKEYVPHDGRIPFLTWLLKVTPLMRIRGHGETISFEFSNPQVDAPLKALSKWCRACAGEFSMLMVRNFATDTVFNVRWGEFDAQAAKKVLESSSCASMKDAGCPTQDKRKQPLSRKR